MSRIRENLFYKNNRNPKDVTVFAHVISSRKASSRRRGLQLAVNRIELIKLRERTRNIRNMRPCLSLNNTSAYSHLWQILCTQVQNFVSLSFLYSLISDVYIVIYLHKFMAWVPIVRAYSQGYINYHKAENWKKKLHFSSLSYYFDLQETSP